MTRPSRALQLARALQDELNNNDTKLSFTNVAMLNTALDRCKDLTENPTNRLDPVNRLPLELVEAIFLLATSHGWYTTVASLAYLAVPLSHVSHRWRQIALNLPRLWIHISVNLISLQAFKAFVQRAKAIPLRISVTKYNAMKMKYLLSITHRIQKFQLCICSKWTKKQLYQVYNLDLPNLEDYGIILSDDPFQWPTCLAGDTSRIETLWLGSISYLKPVVRFPSLTCLTIGDIDDGDINVAPILMLLSQSPLLQEIRLGEVYQLVPEALMPTLPIATLNHLDLLLIREFASGALATFIEQTRINSKVNIGISESFRRRASSEWILPDVSQFNAISSATTLYITRDVLDDTISITGLAKKSLPAINLEIGSGDQIFYDVFNQCPLAQITELWLGPYFHNDWDSPSRASVDTTMLQKLPALRILAFHLLYIRSFEDALSRQASSPDSTLCPNLETIRICWVVEHEQEPIPQAIFDFANHLSQSRPTVHVYAGTRKIAPNSLPASYSNREGMIPHLPRIPDSISLTDHHSNWKMCFGLCDDDRINPN